MEPILLELRDELKTWDGEHLKKVPRNFSLKYWTILEGCPSGQREQTVNLPVYTFDGSNPSPSTGKAAAPLPNKLTRYQEYSAFRWAERLTTYSKNTEKPSSDSEGSSSVFLPAGVAQLVERQPSKLNVAGSNPVARSSDLRTEQLLCSCPPSSVGRARPW